MQHGAIPSRVVAPDLCKVELTGYLFLDAAHMRKRRTDYCTRGNNAGRGIKGGLSPNSVRGIREVHRVFSLRKV